MKKEAEIGMTKDMHFIKVPITEGDKWIGMKIAQLALPMQVLIVAIKRGEEIIIPRGDKVIMNLRFYHL